MFARAIPERLRDEQLAIKRYTNDQAYFTLLYLIEAIPMTLSDLQGRTHATSF